MEKMSLEPIYKLLLGKEIDVSEWKEVPFFSELQQEIVQMQGLSKALMDGNLAASYEGKSDIAASMKTLQGKLLGLLLRNRQYFPDGKMGMDFFASFGDSFKEMAEKIMLLNSIVENTPKAINPITGLSNQESFERMAEALVKFANLNHAELMLFKFTIDDYSSLKQVKSRETMDLLNKHYAMAINTFIREADLLGHYKEGVYNLIITGISIENARLLAWRMSDGLNKNVFHDTGGGTGFFATTSIGATRRLPSDDSLVPLLDRAAIAARTAKKNGGGYIFYEDIN